MTQLGSYWRLSLKFFWRWFVKKSKEYESKRTIFFAYFSSIFVDRNHSEREFTPLVIYMC